MPYSPDVYRRADALDALRDYYATGPEPFYNAVGGFALTSWINACREVEETLTPEQYSSVGWMYGERACCRTTDYLDPTEDRRASSPDAIKTGVQTDLAIATSFFKRVEDETDDPILAAFARLDRTSMPFMEYVLIGRELSTSELETYAEAERCGMQEALEYYQQRKYPADVPRLNVLLARRLVSNINSVNGTGRIILPSSARHRNGGDTDYDNWQFAIYGDRAFNRVQVAPRGAAEILIGPDMLDNNFSATPHGRGGLAACMQFFSYRRRLERAEKLGRPAPLTNVQDRRAIDYYSSTASRLGSYIEEKIQGPPKKMDSIDDATWYETLPPCADPVHTMYGEALAHIATSLEKQYDQGGGGLTTEEMYKLGQVYIDSANSPQLRKHVLSPSATRPILDRAEKLCFYAAERVPKSDPRRYQMLVTAASVSAHKTFLLGDADGIFYYQQQLLVIGSEMLKAHESLGDKKTSEARELANQLHEITTYLIPFVQKDTKQVVLPALPRQRDPTKKQYFDCTVWRRKETGEYAPGPFAIRFGERRNAKNVDDQILTLPRRYADQSKAGDTFAVLSLLHGRKGDDVPKAKKAAEALKGATTFITNFLQQATERKPL